MKFWTQANKGYNTSRIFGNRVRFADDPASNPENTDGDSGGAGGGSGEKSIEELKDELAKAQAERDAAIAKSDKNKRSLDVALKNLADEKKKNREKLSADQQLEADRQELLDRIAELEGQTRIGSFSKKFMGVGMEEAKASELAAVLPAFKDDESADTFFDGLSKFIETAKKTAEENAVQKFIKDNHVDIAGGSGNGQKTDLAVEKAKALREGRSVGANKDILGKYTR